MNRRLLIDCRAVWREISNFIDDEVSPELRDAMEEHFQTCKHCSAIFDGARNVVRLVGDDKSFDLPPKISASLYRKLREYLDRRRR